MKSSIYLPYLQMKMVPAGVILDRIFMQQKKQKCQVAKEVGILPQRINDLIHGTRRFTTNISMSLEHALGIDIPGFFYLIQANHDVYLAVQEATNALKPDLTILTKTTFWDVDLEKIDWTKCKPWALRRVLEYGNAEEIRELDRFYGHDALMEVYKDPSGFRLYDEVKRNFEAAEL